MTDATTTYDGLPRSSEAPFGATVVVYRHGRNGLEFLVLHRAHDGEAYEGDWAWTPPAGARWPDEPPDECAQRELAEQTGLRLKTRRTVGGSTDWLVYAAEAPPGAVVVLDHEHDRFEWLSAEDAMSRCLPEIVGQQIAYVSEQLD